MKNMKIRNSNREKNKSKIGSNSKTSLTNLFSLTPKSLRQN